MKTPMSLSWTIFMTVTLLLMITVLKNKYISFYVEIKITNKVLHFLYTHILSDSNSYVIYWHVPEYSDSYCNTFHNSFQNAADDDGKLIWPVKI